MEKTKAVKPQAQSADRPVNEAVYDQSTCQLANWLQMGKVSPGKTMYSRKELSQLKHGQTANPRKRKQINDYWFKPLCFGVIC